MTSAFVWLDHSDKDRRRVLEAIDRFKDSDTRDELGLASVRDGFADHFFPGTGVMMTRARYFLFVPWLYRRLEQRPSRDRVAEKLRDLEAKLIETLGDQDGTIGQRSKRTLLRMPSNIYWLGLGAWGLRCFDGTQSELHRWLERAGSHAEAARDDDGEPVEGDVRRNWHANLPEPPSSFPKEARFELTLDEAEYLRERIRLSAPRSLLASLFKHPLPDVDFAWYHPALGTFPAALRSALSHAQCFAEVMQGAVLLYNLMLAEADDRDTVDDFREELGVWREEVAQRECAFAAFDLTEFWTLVQTFAHVRAPTVEFVNRWVALRPWQTADLQNQSAARALVRSREQLLKGPRARLVNPRALELWGGRSGTTRLSFRWPTAARLVRDIVTGLEGSARA